MCVCVPTCPQGIRLPRFSPLFFRQEAGGRVPTDTARPTKRVSVGAEAVEEAPLCTCIERNDSTGPPFRCFLPPWFLHAIPPNLSPLTAAASLLSFVRLFRNRVETSSIQLTQPPCHSSIPFCVDSLTGSTISKWRCFSSPGRTGPIDDVPESSVSLEAKAMHLPAQ